MHNLIYRIKTLSAEGKVFLVFSFVITIGNGYNQSTRLFIKLKDKGAKVMNISTDTIIKKLASELEGISVEESAETIHEAMHNIHLITGLWLDEYKGTNQQLRPHFEQPESKQSSYVLKDQTNTKQGNDDTSIFDF